MRKEGNGAQREMALHCGIIDDIAQSEAAAQAAVATRDADAAELRVSSPVLGHDLHYGSGGACRI